MGIRSRPIVLELFRLIFCRLMIYVFIMIFFFQNNLVIVQVVAFQVFLLNFLFDILFTLILGKY